MTRNGPGKAVRGECGAGRGPGEKEQNVPCAPCWVSALLKVTPAKVTGHDKDPALASR